MTLDPLQEFVARLDRRLYAALVGIALGLLGGLLGLSVVVIGAPLTLALLFGVMAALYILTDVSVALYGVIFTTVLLPFGTFPFRLGFTPTLLDAALVVFLVVYLFQWMTGRRTAPRLTPVHGLILVYAGWLVLSFALGLRYASPTSADLRQFAETLLSIGMTFVLVDLLRDPATLRRLVLVVMIAVGLQALAGLVLYVMPDDLAERTLVRLARIGYPNGGVIRYIEDNPALAERAIGTWVDPNAFGGVLAIAAAMIAPQVFAEKPVLRWRWLTALVLGVVALVLVLTFSRASMLALAAALLFVAVLRYRRFLPVMALGAALLLLLPQARGYLERFADAFTAGDLATQMRLGEYTDSLRLISQYPVFGVGFTGTPDISLYTDVASMYLIMANQIGLVGLALYLVTMLAVFAYGFSSWRYAKHDARLAAIHLGYHAALLAALVNAVADLYFFRTDFQASITLFWIVVSLALASSRLAREHRLIGEVD